MAFGELVARLDGRLLTGFQLLCALQISEHCAHVVRTNHALSNRLVLHQHLHGLAHEEHLVHLVELRVVQVHVATSR